jgi:broad specificity phosphatase PhoE
MGAWARTRRIASVRSSPLLRATSTASEIAKAVGVDVIVHPEVAERDYGPYDGKTVDSVAILRRQRGHSFEDVTQDWYGVTEVESDAAVFRRAWPILEPLFASEGKGTTVVVTHAGVIKSCLHEALGVQRTKSNAFKVRNGALVKIRRAGSAYQLMSLFIPEQDS